MASSRQRRAATPPSGSETVADERSASAPSTCAPSGLGRKRKRVEADAAAELSEARLGELSEDEAESVPEEPEEPEEPKPKEPEPKEPEPVPVRKPVRKPTVTETGAGREEEEGPSEEEEWRATLAPPGRPLDEEDDVRAQAIGWIEAAYAIPENAPELQRYPALQPKSLEAPDLARLAPNSSPEYFVLDKSDGTMHALVAFRDEDTGEPMACLVDRTLRVFRLSGFECPASAKTGAAPVHLQTVVEGELVRRSDGSLLWLAFRPVILTGFAFKDQPLDLGLAAAHRVIGGQRGFRCDSIELACKRPVPASKFRAVFDAERDYPIDGLIFVPRIQFGGLGRIASEYKWKAVHTIDLTARIWRMQNGGLRMTFEYYTGVKGCVRYWDFWHEMRYRGMSVQMELENNQARNELGRRAHRMLQQGASMVQMVVECSFKLDAIRTAADVQAAAARDARARKRRSSRMPMDRPPVPHGWRMKLQIERIRDDKKYPNEHLVIVSAMEA